jgi:hypothetical protein
MKRSNSRRFEVQRADHRVAECETISSHIPNATPGCRRQPVCSSKSIASSLTLLGTWRARSAAPNVSITNHHRSFLPIKVIANDCTYMGCALCLRKNQHAGSLPDSSRVRKPQKLSRRWMAFDFITTTDWLSSVRCYFSQGSLELSQDGP